MPTDPLSGSRYPAGTDSADVALHIQRAVQDVSDDTVPRFATAIARDNAYSARVTAGYAMTDGMQCVVNGVPYRRIAGTWRVDRDRMISRTVTPTGSAASIIAGGSAETGITTGAAALANFTLYEAGAILINATFRAGSVGGAATCSVKINGAVVGDPAVSRDDETVSVTATLALAAGTHTVALRVDAAGGTVAWVSARVTIAEGAVE